MIRVSIFAADEFADDDTHRHRRLNLHYTQDEWIEEEGRLMPASFVSPEL